MYIDAEGSKDSSPYAHVFPRQPGCKFQIRHKDALVFEVTQPRTSNGSFAGQNRTSAGCAGHYYCTANAIGSICSFWNVVDFEDYSIAPASVWALLSARKMDIERIGGMLCDWVVASVATSCISKLSRSTHSRTNSSKIFGTLGQSLAEISDVSTACPWSSSLSTDTPGALGPESLS